ncbi:MAG: serine/threonine protein kinase [Verrucomicrobiales bacterium]|nr:serine/threonine protein kinase [Verrucomicrobiales bacterium]|tara:strand:- start:9373 stop:10626 length:1254 start_codon:yes stop_codon:yes gene_type:complete
MRALILILLFVSTIAHTALADSFNWPGWLGPKRNGWVPGVQAPKTWPKELTRGWQIETGQGYGSPLVSDGKVYQHARQGENEVLWCIDLSNGERLWRQAYRVPFKIAGGGDFHGKGPKSSPVIAEGRVFTMGITGVLTAWDAKSGKELWRRDYSNRYRGRFRKPHPNWGASTSPIADGNKVIVHFGTDKEGVLVALDVEDGTEIWSQGNDGASYSSPLIAEINGVRQVVEWNHNALVGVDIETGKELWRHPFPHVGTNQNMPTPTIHKGRVIIGGENRGLHCVELLKIDNDWTVTEHWHERRLALDMASTIANGDLVYGLSHYERRRLFCVDIDSGDIIWKGPERAGQNATFLAIPGHVLALMDHGRLHVLKAGTKEFTKLATYRVSNLPTWAPPVLLPDGFLIKDNKNLTRWSFDR